MNTAPATLPAYVALAGPTASGKTAAAMAIASRYPAEIISVDSALVYCGLDIGTAKPSAAELAAVPHHLINIRDPLQAYSAAEFVTDATRLIQDISARGKLPLLVGGTMLYLKALRHGLDEMPKADAAVRGVIEQEAAQKGWPALHAELALVDPVTAARLAPGDSQRIARALEVYRLSGQPLSSFHKTKTTTPHGTDPGADNLADAPGGVPSLLISLEPWDRARLHRRIAQRFDLMLANGFLDEVRALRARGDLHPDLPSMRCVGYRQAWEYLDALQPPANGTAPTRHADPPPSLSDLREKGIAATRQLAKRQITWLRSMPERHIVACDAPDALAKVLALVDGFLARG
ncbi:tRNA (adenosine(37)-N6)-dimethylallyltransferase MiaA [Rhodoferax sp. U2-2l]|uniref:tRNA (adenosine(37)-N6)-dimethylallyltransferase MiaA n=1 Tax=Rhodoferax sp. U2-2l TaxID=2884000 RepID=UPI001D0BC236|nr:tRNA (adenosine(37)-N6)-dimethylallyltransferase MiaA [Rhodoferax sp. U2-2l]MCB8748415.1 tRNA (adenosine(37)-N6)-dimethylallyltransferase MiaA [Rhodoferax sp. U2-2l]